MSFELIDYSDVCFSKTMKAEVPRRRGGKFIHIINEATGKEYLVLSPRELSVYHANIAERFCRMQNISGTYNSKKDYFTIHDEDWVIEGGGVWAVDDDKKLMELSGASQAYGAFSLEGLKGKLSGSGKFPGYLLVVNGV